MRSMPRLCSSLSYGFRTTRPDTLKTASQPHDDGIPARILTGHLPEKHRCSFRQRSAKFSGGGPCTGPAGAQQRRQNNGDTLAISCGFQDAALLDPRARLSQVHGSSIEQGFRGVGVRASVVKCESEGSGPVQGLPARGPEVESRERGVAG